MNKAIEKKCEKCNRVLYRNFVEIDGEEWEIREKYQTVDSFRPKCWPCSCNDESMAYGLDSPKSRHTDIIKFLAEKGCGC